MTGFEPLIPDVYYNRCGLHSTQRGGQLIVHVDSNRYPVEDFDVHQRLNLILFLNRDWKEEYGGHLEFWNDDTTRCVKKVAPILKSMRDLPYHDTQFSWSSSSIELPGRVEEELDCGLLLHARREPDADYDGVRYFVEWRVTRQGERVFVLNRKIRHFIRQFLPPILLNAIGYLRRGVRESTSKIRK